MAKQQISWYLAKLLRFVTSELGNVSEVASLRDREDLAPRPGPAPNRLCLVPSFQESPWGLGADVELTGGTVERCALAVHRP